MKRPAASLSKQRHQLAGVHWRWVLVAGVAAPIVTVALWVLLVALYALSLGILSHGPPDRARIAQFGAQGAWAVPVLALVLTVVAAAWVVRRVGVRAGLHGALVGAVSGVGSLVAWSPFHGRPGLWGLATVALSVGAGWLGGLEAREVVAGQEALYRASRAIAAAQSPQAIVDAIGGHLAGPRVSRVALWRVVRRGGAGADGVLEELVLLACWAPAGTQPWPAGMRLRADEAPVLSGIRRDAPTAIVVDDLPAAGRAAWERLGVRSATLLPLVARDGTWIGLLALISQAPRGVPRGATGGYLALGAQAELVLENLRLIEQGRQLGAMAERQRLAREIHDSVKQQVFATEMQIAAALELLGRDSEGTRARLAQADALVRQVQEELAAVIHELRPAMLEGKGLAAVLREHAAAWSRQSHIPLDVRVRGERATPLEVEQALYRVAQEALANVARHSRATAASLDLEWQDGAVTLRVADDGRGFAPAEVHGDGYGLSSMSERVAALGGRVSVESEPGRGTRVTCTCPLDGRQEGGASAGWPHR
jgi:signal transduction histidine kinase